MTKKLAIIISAVLFVILVVLLACEVMNPAGGAALLGGLFK